MYLILPEGSRDLLDKFNFSRELFKDYGIRIRPKGIGLSLFKQIDVQSISSELQLWNGDAVTTYPYAFFFKKIDLNLQDKQCITKKYFKHFTPDC